MRLQQFANPCVVVSNVRDSLSTAVQQMCRFDIRHLPVVDEGYPVGMISDRDVLFHACGQRESSLSLTDDGEESLLGALRVEQIMARPVIVLSPEDPVEKAARLMLNKRISAIPLVAGNRIIGIVTETDFLKWYNDDLCPVPNLPCRQSGVADHMAAHIFCLRPADATLTAIRLMRDKQVRHVPILDGDELVGIVSDRDVLRGAPRGEGSTSNFAAEFRVAPHSELRGIMSDHVEVLDLSATLAEAAQRMVRHRFGALPVVNENKLVGIITETDLLRAFVADCDT